MSAILEINSIEKTFSQNFKKSKVLNGVELVVNKGDVYGFLGPNGSGKTTTLKCILGFLKYDSGDVKIFGKSPIENQEVFKKIGYAPENTYFYDHLNGIEFLIFMGQLSGLSKQEAELNGLDLLEKLGLSFAKNKLVKSYSKGMRQRLGLAASLVNDPELIFWDEPMSGLDPLGRIVVKDMMSSLKEKGKTLFFNTHILSDVQEIANRFGIIYNGHIIHEDYTKNIDTSIESIFKEKIYENEKDLKIS